MNAPGTAPTLPVGHADIAAAAARLAGHARRTPVMTSRMVDERTGAQVLFKCENFQRMGAFKFRGAFNAMAQLTPRQKRSGVLAYSSGNHAQAVALAGKLLGVKTVIVMPQDAPRVKLEATRGYGAEVITYDPKMAKREELAAGIAAERGMSVIPPYDHAGVVAGQGTAAKELIEETGPLDYLLVPCGGGGLLSGCAVAASRWSPGCKVIGVEPEAGDDATRSFRSKTLQTCHNPDTIADGARTPSLGTITFPLVLHYVHDMLTVSDAELLRSLFWIWERMKIMIEPTGALAAAALLEGKLDGRHDYRGRRIGVVISGGNADIKALCRLL
ncbi:MAG: threo-3-hydroxy-L-aspartate ammonia-lyase [Betaproteobacteria bacterium]|nr:threo-3-hydroxy-L-aspartate ammonia-lyase [Betaproteobacteria bacterium]